MQTYANVRTAKFTNYGNDTSCNDFLWIRCVYEFVAGNKHCWNISADKKNYNTMQNVDTDTVLRTKIFTSSEIDFGM